MLDDEHFKILRYEPNCTNVFPNTDIKGGLVISYRSANENFGKIGVFIIYDELKTALEKVKKVDLTQLSDLVYAPESYKFTDKMHTDFPNIEGMLSKGHKYDFKSNVFDKLSDIVFFDKMPNDSSEYIQIYGLLKMKRQMKWIKREYIREAENFLNYKVFIPESNSSGELGGDLSNPVVANPLVGHTQTFISMGNFKTKEEAESLLKYVKTKFTRAMLGTLKITQHNAKSTWRNVPIQDFTSASDIDWSKSVAEIDRQLYKKYGLSEDEIDFIETHVKEMT